jgi:hypothetical protein
MCIEIPGAHWQSMPTEEAVRDFAIDTDDFDSFFDSPAELRDVLVHRGDLLVDGPLAINGEKCRLYVIDGSLTINGLFSFENLDRYTSLYVTGSVKAQNMICLWDALLAIGKSLHVKDLLVTYLKDAGSFVVKDSLSAGAWIEAGDHGNIKFARKPKARLLSSAEDNYYFGKYYFGKFGEDADAEDSQDAVLADFNEQGYLDAEAIRDAMLAGKPILRS